MRTIVFICTQGGLGKSTFCLNIGAALVKHSGEHSDKHPHHPMNLLLSRLDVNDADGVCPSTRTVLVMVESARLINRFVSAAENL